MRTCIILILALIPSIANAVEISREQVVPNKPPGYCMWACLETLANVHNIDKLKGIVAKREAMKEFVLRGITYPSNIGNGWIVRRELNANNINYQYQYPGNYAKGLLRDYANDYGCIIVIQTPKSYHALILCRYDDSGVEVYDSTGERIPVTHDWIDKNWIGEVVVILPDGVD